MVNKYKVEQPGFFLTSFIEIYNAFVNTVMNSSNSGDSAYSWCGRIGFRVSGTIEGYVFAMEEGTVQIHDEWNRCRKCAELYQELYYKEVAERKRLAGFSIEVIDTVSLDSTLYVIRMQQPSVTMRVNTHGCVFELYVFTEQPDSAHLDSTR